MFGQPSSGLDALLHRPKPTPWQLFIASPCKFSARLLYDLQQQRHTLNRRSRGTRVICISDTHNYQPEIPDGDILIHAGDLTQSGTLDEMSTALSWLRTLTHPSKVIIAGNHDMYLESEERAKLEWKGITYLQDSATEVSLPGENSQWVYGSAWTPTPGTWAFQYARHEDPWTGHLDMRCDILVTHMPPRFHLDVAGYGDDNLLRELWRTRPRLHVFGHIHAGYGRELLVYDRFQALYERICRGPKGWIGGVKAVFDLIEMSARFIGFMIWSRGESGTVLVNAAIVGGLKDTERRRPVVVYL